MEDLGAPASFLVCKEGTPVYASDGTSVGEVGQVRADEATDIFDGLIVDRGLLGGNRHFVPADSVDEIFERGVVLKLDAAAVERLPENPV